jgi:hypothetical protein
VYETVERAFALLKKRFRCLKDTFDVRNLTQIPKMIIACCVLHNICILQNDVMDINLDDIEQDDEEPDLENNDRE